MADKEITTFVVDVSSSMGATRLLRLVLDLDFGLKYLYDLVAAKALRGRKTDYVTVVAVHSARTDNPYAGDAFQQIEVVCERAVPTYDLLRRLRRTLMPNATPNSAYNQDSLGDCFEGVVLAVLLLKETLKQKFIRNIVLISNGESTITSFVLPIAEATYSAFAKLAVNLMVIGIDFDRRTGDANVAQWTKICREHGGTLLTGEQAVEAYLYHPPMRTVRPLRAFKGQLRFGADHEQLLKSDDLESIYRPELSLWSLCLNVECYPAAKVELLPSAHSYVVDADAVLRVGQKREYFVDDAPPRPVNDYDRVPGFKYSNSDLIALDDGLARAATLHTVEGIDVMGFLNQDSFPYAYLTEEAFYVVPENAPATRSVLGFGAFCQALLDLNCYAVVRYVHKADAEVRMCILLPLKVAKGDAFVYTCSMVRIPFREDEKIGRFPFLAPKGEAESAMKYPSADTNALMESFILAKDLGGSAPRHKVDIAKTVLTATRTSLLPRVSQQPGDPDSLLLSPSPAIHKYNLNLRRMIVASLEVDSLRAVLDDHDFVAKFLVSNEDARLANASARPTNLFNLSNVLLTMEPAHRDWLTLIDRQAAPIAATLLQQLDVRYVTKEEADRGVNRQKPLGDLFKRNPQGTFGADEGEYDEMPDIDNLLELT